MRLLLVFLIFWIAVIVYNAVYNFFPGAMQNIKWLKIAAIICAIVILVIGIKEALQKYADFRFAYVAASDGKILKQKNFPWVVTKTTSREGKIIYIINERFGDASEISIRPDKPTRGYTVYNAIDGIGIKLELPDQEISNFRIEIRN